MQKNRPATKDRFTRCLIGPAPENASGTTLEFNPSTTFEPITDIAGAVYGYEVIPKGWIQNIALSDIIEETAVGLFKGN